MLIRSSRPTEFAGSVSLSLLGLTAHLEGATNNQKFSYLFGVRQKSNQYVLNALETQGDYKPNFFDIQTVLRYHISDKFEVSVLGNYADNKYNFIPETRQTSFGTIQEAKQLTVYFDGQEVDQYKTYIGALKLTFKPNKQVRLHLIGSAYNSRILLLHAILVPQAWYTTKVWTLSRSVWGPRNARFMGH